MIRLPLLVLLGLLVGCGGAATPTKEEIAAENARVQAIIASRSENSAATLINSLDAYWQWENYWYGDPEICVYTFRIPSQGPKKNINLESGYGYKCDKVVPSIISELRILPALDDGVAVDSFAQATFELSEGPDMGYRSTTNVTLKSFEAFPTKLQKIDPAEFSGTPLPLPGVNLESLQALVPPKIQKGKYETSSEFELRKKESAEPRKVLTVYIRTRGEYDADLQIYRLPECYGGRVDLTVKDETSISNQSGVNGFGAEWDWMERSGNRYILNWSCENYAKANIPMDRETARNLGENFTALLQIQVTSQQWRRSRDVDRAEYGRRLSRDIQNYSMSGAVTAVFYGDKTNRKIYGIKEL